jgi:hypothetical protein
MPSCNLELCSAAHTPAIHDMMRMQAPWLSKRAHPRARMG